MKSVFSNVFINFILYYLDRVTPKTFKSMRLFKYNCKIRRFERALSRVSKGRDFSSWVNVYYQVNQYSVKKTNELFEDHQYDIINNINSMDNVLLVDFLIFFKSRGVSCEELYHNTPESISNSKKILLRYSISLLNKNFKTFNHDLICREATDFKLFLFSLNRLGLNIDEARGYEGVENIKCRLTHFALHSDYNYLNISNLIKDTKKKERVKVLFLISKLVPSDILSLYVKFNYIYLVKGNKNKILVLRLLFKLQLIDEYFELYEMSKTNSLTENIVYLFLKNRFDEVIKIYNYLLFFRQIESILKIRNYVYFSYMSVGYKEESNFLDNLEKVGVEVGSYRLLNELYRGSVVNAEVFRGKMPASFQNHISTNYHDMNYSNYCSSKKKLFIAESGVADEIRWARLYRLVDAPNVSVTCDPRFLNSFQESFPNVNFVPFERSYRGRGTSVLEYHKSNIPEFIDEYDFVASTSKLFTLLDSESVLPDFMPYLRPFNDFKSHQKVKVGLLWASGLQSGLRGIRYSISPDYYIPLLERHKNNIEFHCIQSPISDSDRLFCEKYGIIINQDVDLYNDFYSSARYYSSLDFVIGISTLNTELAASTGTIFLHIANAPEVTLMRGKEKDQLGSNTLTISPKNSEKSKSKSQRNIECMKEIGDILEYRIAHGIEEFKEKYC